MLELSQQRAGVQLWGALQIAGDYSGFTKKFSGGERDGKKRGGGAEMEGNQYILCRVSKKKKKRLLNPSPFIRLRFVFWLGRDVPRIGGIKGICWWMKFSRMGFHERKDKAGIRSISPFVPLQMKGTWTGRSQFLKAVLCASWILARILVTITEKPKHLQLKYFDVLGNKLVSVQLIFKSGFQNLISLKLCLHNIYYGYYVI